MKMSRLFVSVVAAVIGLTAVARAEIIDRILAVVGGEIITLSDVNAALRFSLVPPDVSTDPVSAALQRLIDRRVLLEEVDRYQPPEPAPEAVAAELASLRAKADRRVPLDTALQQSGMTPEQLRAYARDTLRIDSYIQQRFAAAIQPPDEDIARYYREHQAEFTVNGALRPLETVRDDVVAAIVRQRRETFLTDTLEGLRRRSSIVVLYLPPAR